MYRPSFPGICAKLIKVYISYDNQIAKEQSTQSQYRCRTLKYYTTMFKI